MYLPGEFTENSRKLRPDFKDLRNLQSRNVDIIYEQLPDEFTTPKNECLIHIDGLIN